MLIALWTMTERLLKANMDAQRLNGSLRWYSGACCVCVYAYSRAYACMCVCVHVYLYVCVYVYLYVCAYVYVFVRVCVHTRRLRTINALGISLYSQVLFSHAYIFLSQLSSCISAGLLGSPIQQVTFPSRLRNRYHSLEHFVLLSRNGLWPVLVCTSLQAYLQTATALFICR